MPNLADLEQRLRTVAGPDPDIDRALDDVTGRIRRRSRRAGLAVAAVVVLLAGLATMWGLDQARPDRSSVLVGEPPAPSDSFGPSTQVMLRELWSAEGVGMSGSWSPSGGRLVAATSGAVFAAGGFEVVGPHPVGQVVALDRDTGEVRWAIELGDPAFLQGATATTVIASTQHERIVGLSPTDGSIRWELSLTSLGLEGYGAVTSTVGEARSAIGVSAMGEGDTRPPVILGIDTETGSVAWTTTLAEGTDLMWGTPPESEGETVFTSTLSHPDSAEENLAHLIDLDDGSIRWTAGMGGSQGFSDHGAVINGPVVHLPAHPDVLTVDRGDGTPLWSHPGYGPTVFADGTLRAFGAEGTLDELDAASGSLINSMEVAIVHPTQLLDLGDGLIAVVSRLGLTVIDTDGENQAAHTWDAALIDRLLLDGDVLLVPTEDRALTALVVEDPTATGHGSAADPAGDLQAFCKALDALDHTDGTTDANIVLDAFEEVRSTAPRDIRDDVNLILDHMVVLDYPDAADPSMEEASLEERQASGDRLSAYADAHC